DLLPGFVVDESDLNRIAPDLKRVDADDRARPPLSAIGVHALDDGDHGNEERNRDDDAEECKERTELMAPDRIDGENDGFEEGHGWKIKSIRIAELSPESGSP